MDKNILLELVDRGFSTYDIAKELNCSQTNTRHWLRKFGLNTKHKPRLQSIPEDKLHSQNGLFCVSCNKELIGYNTTYCDNKCKTAFYYKNNKVELINNTCKRQKIVSKKLTFFMFL